MKNKGYALLYVIILVIPIMMISLDVVEMITMDYKTNSNVVDKAQTYYNSECGIVDASKKYKSLNYGSYRECTYYFSISDEDILFNVSKPRCMDYTKVKVSYNIWGSIKTYTIEATGYYNNCTNTITKNIEE